MQVIIETGMRELGWRRLLAPTYLCPSVMETVSGLIAFEGYQHLPLEDPVWPDLAREDAILVAAHFGVEPKDLDHLPSEKVVLDLTHDPIAPWAKSPRYAFAFASLRKTLPVADGGLAWRTGTRGMPSFPRGSAQHVQLVQKMVLAMFMKAEYLSGADADKAEYLSLARQFEEQIGDLPFSLASTFTDRLLPLFPVDDWQESRLQNSQKLASLLQASSTFEARSTPFGVVLLFPHQQMREAVRSQLIDSRVYSAVLWDLAPTLASSRDTSWSRRMLHLHSDFRYAEADLERVSALVLQAVEGH